MALIAGSIRECGFTNPVLVDGGNGIIAGRGRVMAARRVLNDDRADWSDAWALLSCEIAWIRHGAQHATSLAQSLEARGFAIRSQSIRAKERLMLSRSHYHWQHEPCW